MCYQTVNLSPSERSEYASLLKSGTKKFHHPYTEYPWVSVTQYCHVLNKTMQKYCNMEISVKIVFTPIV